MSGDRVWSLREVRTLVRGPSAFALLGWVLWGVGIGLVLLIVLVVGMLVRGTGYGGSPFSTVVMIAILLDAAFLNWVVIWVQAKKRREARAGYATVMNEKSGLEQVDSRTGRVIRLAGEPFLTRQEHLRRIGLIRESVKGEQLGSAGDGTEPLRGE
ncbi:hypothetical protein [Promicromonospora iranensis]|uniref:PH (Pleckstrin Homology) domain-containing protein n=1 Tax=Promicromonospora iranensis TaxID=1105144 RepID=A0ABU2CM18_9MICO|nr:hypothetical protein [Promicromonospora iranensis]MDR7382217.1 hypothetical protein [Promicromonospora iranensis]